METGIIISNNYLISFGYSETEIIMIDTTSTLHLYPWARLNKILQKGKESYFSDYLRCFRSFEVITALFEIHLSFYKTSSVHFWHNCNILKQFYTEIFLIRISGENPKWKKKSQAVYF